MSKRLIASTLLVAGVASCASCLDVFKLHLPDGGEFTFPDAGLVDGGLGSLLFEGFMPNPAALEDGGTLKYGGVSVTVSLDGGERYFAISSGGHVLETYVYWNGDDSYVTGTGDLNEDGQIDWQYASGTDGGTTFTTTTLTDSDFDGVFDTQDVWVVDTSAGYPFQMTETLSFYQLPDGGSAEDGDGGVLDGGAWVQQWTYSGPAQADQNGGGSCNSMTGFPILTIYSGKFVNVPNTQIQILDDPNTPGACDDSQAQDLLAVFEAALEDIPLCLLTIRPELAALVETAVQKHPLFVACGNTCVGSAAGTMLPCKPGPTYLDCVTDAIKMGANDAKQQMNLNASWLWSQPSLEWREETLIHELLHFQGQAHSPPPAGNPQGHDMVYGCGRFCVGGGLLAQVTNETGGCQSPNGVSSVGWVTGATPTAAQYGYDCADCANDADRRRCGAVANITDCSGGDCSLHDTINQCEPGATCCAYNWRNCWGNQALPVGAGGRKPDVRPVVIDDCIEQGTQCVEVNSSSPPIDGLQNCSVGPAQDLVGDRKANCASFPIAWCLGN